MATVPEIVVPVRFELVPPDCDSCENNATCVWSAGGSRSQLACNDHDPTKQPGWAASPTPPWFMYQTVLPHFAVTSVSAHVITESATPGV